MKTIQEALEFRRCQYGITAERWAKNLGMQKSHYSEFVSGKRELPKRAMAKAFAFGVPVKLLFGCDPDKGVEDLK